MPVQRPTPQSHYYSGQGRLIIGERDPLTGAPLLLREVGNCTAVEITVATTKTDHKESMSGLRSIDLTLVTEKSATFTVTCESLSLDNLALGLWGETITSTATPVADEVHPIAKGGFIALSGQNVTAVVVETVENTPVTLVAGTDYEVDPDFGTIRFSDTVTLPVPTNAELGPQVTVSFTPGAGVKVLHGLTQLKAPERFVRFEGVNTVDGELVLVEIPRASFEPLQNLGLINEELGSFEMSGTILLDNLITSGSKFFRQTYITPSE